jgi:glyoxylase-like metal-dependent hydrolase (beta-lactamase superfamily II)
MTAEIRSFFHDDTSTYSYVAWDPATKTAAVIDPVLDYDPAAGATATDSVEALATLIGEEQLTLRWILETHAHADHVSAAPWLKQRFPRSEVVIGHGITAVLKRFSELFNLGDDFPVDGSQFDRLVAEGDSLPLGELDIRVIATPGHTSDSLTYVIENAAFVGDSIFMPDMGTARCDFPGGDATELYQSIQKLFSLPDDTRLYMCHDYAPGGREHANVTTVAEERERNIHVGSGKSLEDFRDMRTARDRTLGAPRLLYPAVQINIRAGELPPAESNGITYIRIPLNQFGGQE